MICSVHYDRMDLSDPVNRNPVASYQAEGGNNRSQTIYEVTEEMIVALHLSRSKPAGSITNLRTAA